jgi:glycerate 2-kinase
VTKGIGLAGDLYLNRCRRVIPEFLAALSPERLLADTRIDLSSAGDGPLYLLSTGKASASLTRALSGRFGIPAGQTLTILPEGYPPPDSPHVFGSHPLPTGKSRRAASRALSFVEGIPVDGFLICAISGGTSSLMSLPAPSISHKDKARVLKALMERGAPIEVLNAVRTHLSSIKGGGLLKSFRGRAAATVLLSDTPCLPPEVVGSGPSIPVPRNGPKTLEILEEWLPGKDIPHTVKAALSGMNVAAGSWPFRQMPPFVLGDSSTVVMKARDFFVPEGTVFEVLTPCLKGEAREAGTVLASLLLPRIARENGPMCFLASGETTVSIGKKRGIGGRTFELGLSLGASLGRVRAVVGCLATDGMDGNSGMAGVLFASDRLTRGALLGKLRTALASHDAGGFAERHGFAVRTGPTETNLNDLLWVYVPPSR